MEWGSGLHSAVTHLWLVGVEAAYVARAAYCNHKNYIT